MYVQLGLFVQTSENSTNIFTFLIITHRSPSCMKSSPENDNELELVRYVHEKFNNTYQS